MRDECRIERPGLPVLDQVTLKLIPGPSTVLYQGKCRVGSSGESGAGEALETIKHAGERQIYEVSLVISVPVAVRGVRVDDRVVITSSPLDPEVTGRNFLVQGVTAKSHATARRLVCREMTA